MTNQNGKIFFPNRGLSFALALKAPSLQIFFLTIEVLQMIIGHIIGLTYRSFDVDDFILNIFGAYIGFVCSRIVLKPYKEKINKKIFSNR